jgi:hypothetical protein
VAEPAADVHRLSADRSPSLDDITVDEQEQPGGTVQTLRAASGSVPEPAVSAQAIDAAPAGRPLDPGVRTSMQAAFGVDFGRVRIHSDRQAGDLAGAVGARAFTYGADIFFAGGEYRPGERDGMRVLAHELTHVVQQGAARPASGPATGPGVGPQVSPQAPAMARLSAAGPATQHNVRPWGPDGPIGSNHEANTDGGSTVPVWIGYPIFSEPNLYWCHGHSLDSFRTYGYSVYSGPPMATVVKDEWTNIAADQTKAGDIAVWTQGFDHSAKFTAPKVEGGALDPAGSMLSTKNGRNPLATMSLTALAGIYGGAGIAVFRRKP